MSALTLDVEVYPPADGGRHVVAGDAEVGAHVLAPHPVDLQGVAGPHLQSQSIVVVIVLFDVDTFGKPQLQLSIPLEL